MTVINKLNRISTNPYKELDMKWRTLIFSLVFLLLFISQKGRNKWGSVARVARFPEVQVLQSMDLSWTLTFAGEWCWDLDCGCHSLLLSRSLNGSHSSTSAPRFRVGWLRCQTLRGYRGWGQTDTSHLHPCAEMCWLAPSMWQRPACSGMSLGWGKDVLNEIFFFKSFPAVRPSRGFKLFLYQKLIVWASLRFPKAHVFAFIVCLKVVVWPIPCGGFRLCVSDLDSFRWCQVHYIYGVIPWVYPHFPFINDFQSFWRC